MAIVSWLMRGAVCLLAYIVGVATALATSVDHSTTCATWWAMPAPEAADAISDPEIVRLLGEKRLADATVRARALVATAEQTTGVESREVAVALADLMACLEAEGLQSLATAEALATEKRLDDLYVRWHGAEDERRIRSLGWLSIGQFYGLDPETAAATRHTLEDLADRHLAAKPLELASVLGGLAQFEMYRVCDFKAAERHYRRVVDLVRQALGPTHVAVARQLHEFAKLYLHETDEFEKAQPLIEEALRIREAACGERSEAAAMSVNQLGVYYFAIGDLPRAEQLYEAALQIRRALPHPRTDNTPQSLINLASLYLQTGRLAKAREANAEVISRWEKRYGPWYYDLRLAQAGLGEVELADDHPELALPHLERALEIAERRSQRDPGVVDALLVLAPAAAALGDSARGIALARRALALSADILGPDHPRTAAAKLLLAKLLVATGSNDEPLALALETERAARSRLAIALPVLPERQALTLVQALPQAQSVALTLVRRRADDAARRAVYDAVIRRRALVLDEVAARRRVVARSTDPALAALWTALEVSTQRFVRTAQLGLGATDRDPRPVEIESARREWERAEAAFALQSATFRRERARVTAGLDEVEHCLRPGEALVSFVRHEEAIVPADATAGRQARIRLSRSGEAVFTAIVLRAGDAAPSILSIGAAPRIDQLVTEWRNKVAVAPPFLASAARAAEKAAAASGTRLRRAVWDPIAPLLSEVRTVYIVPDGLLQVVDFAALPREGGGYLVEDSRVLTLLSAERDLAARGAGSTHGHGLLAIGGPDFGPARPPSETLPGRRNSTALGERRSPCRGLETRLFAPLPFAQREVNDVAAMWDASLGAHGVPAERSTVLSGAAATEDAFKSRAPLARVIHLATHGFFLGERCTREPSATSGTAGYRLAGLAFANANRRGALLGEPGAGEDGVMTAEEVATLDLSGVDAAILSACDTAAGDVVDGEGVLGLRRAFQVAGVRELVMTLWRVPDDTTLVWMQEFYRQHSGGVTNAEAVRRTDLAVLTERRARGLATHPFYWGAFVVAGAGADDARLTTNANEKTGAASAPLPIARPTTS